MLVSKIDLSRVRLDYLCGKGHLKHIRICLKQGVKVDESATYEASFHNRLDVVQELIRYSAPIDGTALMCAARKGNLEIVRELIKYNAPVDDWAVYFAAGNGHRAVVNLLLDYRAPVKPSSVHYAAREGHLGSLVRESSVLQYRGFSQRSPKDFTQESPSNLDRSRFKRLLEISIKLNRASKRGLSFFYSGEDRCQRYNLLA